MWQVVEISTSKSGKHAHAKCGFVGIDIFTAKKLEDIIPSSHNCDVCFSSNIFLLLLALAIFKSDGRVHRELAGSLCHSY